MKNLFNSLLLLTVTILTSNLIAQDCGMLTIKNASPNQPKFIASINGVRPINVYASSITYDCLDEQNYRVQFLIAGASSPIQFSITSLPNYISNYVLNRDVYGKFSLILESKLLMGLTTQTIASTALTQTLVPTNTAVITPTVITTTTTTQPVSTNTIVQQPSLSVAPVAMNDAEFNGVVNMLKKESLESTRTNLAKSFLRGKNLNTTQVVTVLKTFNLERNKLDLAKHFYAQTLDKQNYFSVMDVFSLSSSKKDLSDFMNKSN